MDARKRRTIAAWLAAAAVVFGLAASPPGEVGGDSTTGWGHCCS